MTPGMLYNQVQDLKRIQNALEAALTETNNAIYMAEERMYDLEEEENGYRRIGNR
jgi:hypothetical protein